ncbi:Rtt106-domain-containing protein [Hortaea werneckii]|nr:Rtt106-domain-containing protein [Hortaea werneckii]KAI6996718.1 Rtt106-domain-containing protein [Hortaea werneckii]KAI7147973.1 Rtt106-domain-containing protein [Hortaea werneckii]KAI7177511.1 Rtt106-domain-containing protein [Hortaea werneckii]
MSDYKTAIQSVFPKPVCKRIESAVQQHPKPEELALLFHDVAYLTQQAGQQGEDQPSHAKKRKLDDRAAVAHANGTSQPDAQSVDPASLTTILECKDVSFQIPARKKLKLHMVRDSHDVRRQEIRLVDQKTSTLEHSLPADQIEHAFCLPVPEKQQRQCNFVLLPKPGASSPSGAPCEQVLFTLNEIAPQENISAEQKVEEGDTLVSIAERDLSDMLGKYGKKITRPTEKEFASAIPQSHRKGEKAWHVKAHRGTKEGYLWFLSTGILFGFKKPIAFFPFTSIDSISYTSVLQRTFNLVIAARDDPPPHRTDDAEEPEAKEIEFSMLDQQDFAGIDEYVKRHGLNDASMAAQRRAKMYNVNKEKKVDGEEGAEGNGTGEGEEESELQKAEQQLQDDEDEDEEDYVASGGESEGEGESSDEEGEGGEDAGEDEMDEDEVSGED